ncbi:hypothetical protein VTI74DRAFT_8706 [Chaetomium olivicolor]
MFLQEGDGPGRAGWWRAGMQTGCRLRVLLLLFDWGCNAGVLRRRQGQKGSWYWEDSDEGLSGRGLQDGVGGGLLWICSACCGSRVHGASARGLVDGSARLATPAIRRDMPIASVGSRWLGPIGKPVFPAVGVEVVRAGAFRRSMVFAGCAGGEIEVSFEAFNCFSDHFKLSVIQANRGRSLGLGTFRDVGINIVALITFPLVDGCVLYDELRKVIHDLKGVADLPTVPSFLTTAFIHLEVPGCIIKDGGLINVQLGPSVDAQKQVGGNILVFLFGFAQFSKMDFKDCQRLVQGEGWVVETEVNPGFERLISSADTVCGEKKNTAIVL